MEVRLVIVQDSPFTVAESYSHETQCHWLFRITHCCPTGRFTSHRNLYTIVAFPPRNAAHNYVYATSLAIVLFRGPVQLISLVCLYAHHHSTLTPCREAVPTPTSSRPIGSPFSTASSIRRIAPPSPANFRNGFQCSTPFSNVASGHSDFLIGFRSATYRGKLAFYCIDLGQVIYYRKRVMVTDHVLHPQINEHIASCLDSDEDIQNFRLICQTTNVAVTHYRCGLWRELYARRYDVRPGMKGVDVRMTYMIRTKFLRRINPFFYIGQEYRELVCLEKLRDLVIG